MRTLIDTCVLSEVPMSRGDPRVKARLQSIDHEDVFISVITVGELVRGVERLGPGPRQRALESWVREIEERHADRVLPVDARVARIWGNITAQAGRAGRTIPAADGLIAATALRHDLALMTRNTPDFEASGARLIDPWAEDM